MDLLLMMNNRTRTVIEVSGRQHYPDVEANTAGHAETMAEDREPTMQHYEVHRIGGQDPQEGWGSR
ncbi:hypothetical protein ABZY10_29055 [Streptomyces sp. NPDC006539]|uniref:hypothetical protein n=1 Tax=Streptomyces sp. NPDC006539 TaxID=3155352 RepID=UPI0033B6ED8A